MTAASLNHIVAILAVLLLHTQQLRSQSGEEYMNTCDIIRLRGYECTEHTVITKDKYILTMHRLSPKQCGEMKKPGRPIILQHGLLQSSIHWVINYANQSLGFLLANAGYDVWLGNIRGNIYSKGHTSLSPYLKEYWNFTFDQMAEYDLPAMVEYVLQVTNHSSLDYVGHSQGTLIGFACFSEKPDWARQKIRSFHAFAPVAYVGHTKTVLRLLRPFFQLVNWMLKHSHYEILPNTDGVKWVARKICKGKTVPICEKVLHKLGGYEPRNVNATRLSIYLSHYPAGTSTLNIAHFGQLIKTNKMQKFDYGTKGNLLRYNQTFPPQYHPERSRVPTALYWGANDVLSVEKDVRRLINITHSELGLYRYENTEHVDFMWGLNMIDAAYAQLMRVLSKLPAR